MRWSCSCADQRKICSMKLLMLVLLGLAGCSSWHWEKRGALDGDYTRGKSTAACTKAWTSPPPAALRCESPPMAWSPMPACAGCMPACRRRAGRKSITERLRSRLRSSYSMLRLRIQRESGVISLRSPGPYGGIEVSAGGAPIWTRSTACGMPTMPFSPSVIL